MTTMHIVLQTNLIYIPQPLGYIVKCLGVCDIVDQHDAHGPSVVRRSNGVESLLACSVPVLQKKKNKNTASDILLLCPYNKHFNSKTCL